MKTDVRSAVGAWSETTVTIVAILILVQIFTGVLLTFYYVPSVDHAYTTVSYIEKVVSSGSWIRSLHHYGSQWLTLFAFLHVIQLFLNKAYLDRRLHWTIAVVILGLVLAAGGTGYSLPWDARAFFSTRVAEGLMAGLPFVGRNARLWLLGGSEISTLTLSRFFAVHVVVISAFLLALISFLGFGHSIVTLFDRRHAAAAGIVFVALALWSLKYHAPLGPAVPEMTAEYLPRPGAQFLWLYQSLKYIPGGLGSLAGVALPGIALLVLMVLPWTYIFRPQITPNTLKIVGGLILGVCVVLVSLMTTASYLSDRLNQQTRAQLARQAAQEEVLRREPFNPALINLAGSERPTSPDVGEPPVLYVQYCANCHGRRGEGGQQGPLRFPPLLDVSAKPRRTVEDIVGLLKDPKAFGLELPMRSFSDKLTEEQMREIANWIVKLKR
jgi:ubiquinol-cytochrome c reductase cytochrome b subunit